MPDLIESMACGAEGRSLTEFLQLNGLSSTNVSDWGGMAVEVNMSGCQLDNLNGEQIIVEDGDISNEYLLHLKGRRAKVVLNLATLLGMAAAYCLDRQLSAQNRVSQAARNGKHKPARKRKSARK